MEKIRDFKTQAYVKMRTDSYFSAGGINTDLLNIHQDSAYAYRTVAKWVSLFNQDHPLSYCRKLRTTYKVSHSDTLRNAVSRVF